jgi:rhodanese-related sulfurtransferase
MINLDVSQFAEKITDQNVIVLDVRTPAEFSQGRIAKSINIDVLSDYFIADIAGLDKDAQYAIYCRSGKRSVDAADAMDEIGFSTFNLLGGIVAWQESNNELIV